MRTKKRKRRGRGRDARGMWRQEYDKMRTWKRMSEEEV